MMDEQTRKALRLTRIGLYLLAGETLTRDQIAAMGGVSERTAQRDILAIEQIIPTVVTGGFRSSQLTVRAVNPSGAVMRLVRKG